MKKKPEVSQHNLIYMEIGLRLKEARKKKGYNQEQLATGLGLTRTSIVNIERGRQCMTIENLIKSCAILDCEPKDLLPPTPKAVAKEINKVKRVVESKTLAVNFKW